MFDAKALAGEISLVVKDYVGRATQQMQARIDDLERQVKSIPAGRDGKDGAAGKDIDPEFVAARLAEMLPGMVKQAQDELAQKIDKSIEAIEVPRGDKGEPGKDADPEQIRLAVEKAVSGLPKPKDGTSVTVADVEPVLESHVARWALEFERRATDQLQKAVDRIPAPKVKDGQDGKDGLDLKDLDVALDDDGRTIIFKMADAERTKEWRITPPIVLDAGLFEESKSYTKGDGVTWGGNLWISQKHEPAGKPRESPDWRLAVKRGREGKAGDPGKPGHKGADGRDGRDLTQMGPDGSKW